MFGLSTVKYMKILQNILYARLKFHIHIEITSTLHIIIKFRYYKLLSSLN